MAQELEQVIKSDLKAQLRRGEITKAEYRQYMECLIGTL
jgi:hypothetical protein